MDERRFDRFTRSLQPNQPLRRGLLALLLAVPGTAMVSPILAGAKAKKVRVCHQGQTLSVSKIARKKHLKHGDTAGPCPPTPPPGGCTPSCAGKICGQDDGCGEVCITQAGCAAGRTCSPQGQCSGGLSCLEGQIWCPGTDYCGAGNCCSDFGGGAVSSGLVCGGVCVNATCCAVGGPAPSGGGACCGNGTPQGGSCCLPEGAYLSNCATRSGICCSGACNGDLCA
jgi:hypothetical protein